MKRFLTTPWLIGIIILFHSIGLLIWYAFPSNELFQLTTPFHLILMFFILAATQDVHALKNRIGWIALIIIAFAIEVIGVTTGFIFGNYEYGKALGPKLFNTPLLIGLLWLSLTLSSVIIAESIIEKIRFIFIARSAKNNTEKNKATWAIALLAATLMVLQDFWIEKMAMKVDYWYWENNSIPLKNYIDWFAVSAVFAYFISKFTVLKPTAVAWGYYVVQMIFLICLQF